MVLEMLHLTHGGMSDMKMLARSYVWWPNLNTGIERIVKTCIDSPGPFMPKWPNL